MISATRTRLQVLGLSVIVLGVYYSCVFSPVTPLDDRALIQWLVDSGNIKIGDLFLWTTGSYYRPILQLSYVLDMKFWGASPASMHLENVLLHLANTLLIYSCTRKILHRLDGADLLLSFWAALLFALHPVNTEPVNWIAGRSDLLACFFVLVTLQLLLIGHFRGNASFTYLSLVPLGLGVLSKETAIFFIPAAIFILVGGAYQKFPDSKWTSRVRSCLPLLAPYLLLPAIYLVFRFFFYLEQKHDSAFGLTRLLGNLDGGISVTKSVMTALGFYVKKILIPWPLNFTIYTVSGHYLWLGLVAVALIFLLFWRMDFAKAFILASFCMVMSALLVIALRPAWTPVAERYLYIPSAFFSVGIALFLNEISLSKSLVPALKFIAVGIVIIFAISTIQRNILWLDNVALFEDAAEKSPEFPFVRSILADLLIETGRIDEGRKMILQNQAPKGMRNADFLELKRAQVFFDTEDYMRAREIILSTKKKEDELYFMFQRLLSKVDYALLHAQPDRTQGPIFSELVSLYLELQEAYSDPFYFYQLGRLYMQFDDKKNATRFFLLAATQAPDDAHYKAAAVSLAKTLAEE